LYLVCTNPVKNAVVSMFVRGVDFVAVVSMFVRGVDFVAVMSMFVRGVDFVAVVSMFVRGVDFESVSTICSVEFWNCSDGVVFLELLRRCGIFSVFFILLYTATINTHYIFHIQTTGSY
jgi:hypothetical protein